MTGKFSNTISKVSNNGNNNNNSNSGNNSILRGIPVIEISTPQYVLKKEDMGSMLFISANCDLDFSNITDISTFIVYIVSQPPALNVAKFIANNKTIEGITEYSAEQTPLFVVVRDDKVYTKLVF
ncbi:hypothetical protein [Capnocytophaga sputigena]|uniref:hypothetical protein n=1 Tax=Capnocytophaga sputigena TaxID=1019 RepID=UPI000BB1C25A|nr:hypothetical protein [Capnocytophaga sputigena]ATA69638.1 hypothetical protein CGC57_01405 [Capnocytophaga sputigena]